MEHSKQSLGGKDVFGERLDAFIDTSVGCKTAFRKRKCAPIRSRPSST